MRSIVNQHLFPDDEGDLFNFLRLTTQEWQFFTNADALGLPEASPSTVVGATLARDSAIDQWNHWMYRQRDREWFLVHQHHVLDEDYHNEQRGIFLVAGSSVMVVHRCESVLAAIKRCERTILAPNGGLLPTGGVDEEVELHCVLAPPHDDTLKVLPVNVVPNVAIFNH
ncbi:MAG: hypothetical protein Q7R60_02910 [bacterium]|nr:hypothetical protein [bacterium]